MAPTKPKIRKKNTSLCTIVISETSLQAGLYWGRCVSSVRLKTSVVAGPSQDVDVVLKLKVSLGPQRTEQYHHAYVDEDIKYEVHSCHNHFSPDCIDCHAHYCQQGQVQEPDGIAHGQNDVQAKSRVPILYKVDLAHFVQNVHKDEQPVGQVQATSPTLVAMVQLCRQWVVLLRYLSRQANTRKR